MVGVVASVAGGVMKGEGDQAAADYQSAKLEKAAQYGRLAADQTDAQMRENLNTQIGNIDAVRAAAGIDPTSPTTAALRDRTEMLGGRDRSIQVGNILAKANQDQADAAYTKEAGSYAMGMDILGGIAGGAGKIAGTNWSNFGKTG